MWGQICTESSHQLNFNFGFSSHKSDVLLHLSQWQYWWWFWFSFFWTFYYFVIIRTVKNRVTKMNPKFNTSLRGRGKWGDFLIAILPLSWCINILLNSNFILRMFEWQNESSLFTVRIHGKQWYWIYKFDLTDIVDILTVPKNMGRNRWVIGTPREIIVCESYTQALQLRSQRDWIKKYWKKKVEDDLISFKTAELDSLDSSNHKVTKNYVIEDNLYIFNAEILKNIKQYYNSYFYKTNINFFYKINLTKIINSLYKNNNFNFFENWQTSDYYKKFDAMFNNYKIYYSEPNIKTYFKTPWERFFVYDFFEFLSNFFKKITIFDFFKNLKTLLTHNPTFFDLHKNFKFFDYLQILKKNVLHFDVIENIAPNLYIFTDKTTNSDFYGNTYYNDDVIEDTWDLENNIRQQTNTGPIRLVKHFLTEDYFKNNSDLLQFNFYETNDHMALKIPDNDNFWVLKQKRYKKKQDIKLTSSESNEYADFETVRNIYKKHIIENIKLITDLDFLMDPYALYKCMRGNRNRTESLPVHLYRRLLRTKRTLVLPAHINMTVVTNSYDVIHSWFLPGLGIKMDCVPGRATHHSLYLDNIGFYYGQCAEICGRYHHHMPIRVCALPFEHFLVWWQLKGAPKLLRLKKNKETLVKHVALKYSW